MKYALAAESIDKLRRVDGYRGCISIEWLRQWEGASGENQEANNKGSFFNLVGK